MTQRTVPATLTKPRIFGLATALGILILDQLTKVHTLFCGKEEEQAAAIIVVLCANDLHGQEVLFDLVLAADQRVLLLLAVVNHLR